MEFAGLMYDEKSRFTERKGVSRYLDILIIISVSGHRVYCVKRVVTRGVIVARYRSV